MDVLLASEPNTDLVPGELGPRLEEVVFIIKENKSGNITKVYHVESVMS